jgi:hypothetical protein
MVIFIPAQNSGIVCARWLLRREVNVVLIPITIGTIDNNSPK